MVEYAHTVIALEKARENLPPEQMPLFNKLLTDFLADPKLFKENWHHLDVPFVVAFTLGQAVTQINIFESLRTELKKDPLDELIDLVISELNLSGETSELFKSLAKLSFDPKRVHDSMGSTAQAAGRLYDRYPNSDSIAVSKAIRLLGDYKDAKRKEK